MGEADCFFLGNERAMQRSGQGIHLCQTVIELEGEPDVEKLRDAMRRLVQRHPAIVYCVHTSSMPGRPPELAPSKHPAEAVPFQIWDDVDAPNELCDKLVNLSEIDFNADGTTNLRCDLLRLTNGSSRLLFTWRHVIFDGFGAELLVSETAALAQGDDSGYVTVSTAPQNRVEQKGGSMLDHVRAARPVEEFFLQLLNRYRFRAFSGPKPRSGRGRFTVHALSKDDSARIFERAASHCGLFTTPFFLACATRAHHRVWKSRGEVPDAYLMSLPVQLRKSGAKGPLMQNNISFMFFWSESGEVEDIAALCKKIQRQHAEFLKKRLNTSFLNLLQLMRHAPPRFYAWYIRHRMRGEFNSFYHSNTGELAADCQEIAGAKVQNAFHIPLVFNPPGTGLFLNQKNGQLTVVTTWRHEVLTEAEHVQLRDEFLNAMLEG